jgi:hypothetical protein
VSPRLAILIAGLCALGCASGGGAPAGSWQFFAQPDPEPDVWHQKIENWQERELRDLPELSLATGAGAPYSPQSGELLDKMALWESEERLALVKRLTEWAQAAARRHYRFDPETDVAGDPWPTTKDLLDTNGDDCDGLDLITYELMREFGFPREQLYRAIVRRDRDGANHMITLWFEDPVDPWVIDATGAVSMKVRRFSDLPGWTPIRMFNEREQYRPSPGVTEAGSAGRGARAGPPG